MAIRSGSAPGPQVTEDGRPLPFSVDRRQEILAAYDRFNRSEKGALLRRGRAYRQLTSRWRREAGAIAAELERARHMDDARPTTGAAGQGPG